MIRRRALLLSLLAGPISGPLALGLLAAVRDRRPAMAAVYAFGIVEVAIGLPWLALHLAVSR